MRRTGIRQKDAFEADQAEARAIREGVASVASSALDDRISGEAQDADDQLARPVLEWNDEPNQLDELTGRALDTILQRKSDLGVLYPFAIDRSQLSYVPSGNGVYEFCLATCESTGNPSRRYRQLLRHFERLACDLVTAHIGNSARGVRFGWPSESDFEEVPNGLSRRLDWLRETGRFHGDEWTLQTTSIMKRCADRMKDARIDFVIRCSLLDDRPGGLTFIGQCGCGKNDVDDSSRKFEEVTEEWLSFFFATTSVVKPLKLFATSQHLADDDRFYVRQGASQCVFIDRIRLTLMASRYWDQISTQRQNWLKSLTERIF